MTERDPRFDPDWRDDIFHPEAIDMLLVFPRDTPNDNEIWVHSKVVRREEFFGKEYIHDTPRRVKAIVKKNELSKKFSFVTEDGTRLPPDHPMLDFVFPPKAWISDNMQERCMTFSAAKLARGNILVGGLGLAIYPQMVFHLKSLAKQPVTPITIVEREPYVIDLINNSWLKTLSEAERGLVHIVEGTIENYLQTTDHLFDTIYLDTWEDADPRFLPYINYLVQLALPKCATGGQIQCWGYALMVDTFIRDVKMCEEQHIPLDEAPQELDPALKRYVAWRQKREEAEIKPEVLEGVARDIALTTAESSDNYNRDNCFTLYQTLQAATLRRLSMKGAPTPDKAEVEKSDDLQ
jgi:hypothetical protein